MKYLLSSLALTLFGIGSAHAAIMDFNFSYTFSSGETLSGVLRGDLQSDNDTILITAIPESVYSGDLSLVFNSALYDDPATLDPEQNFASLTGTNPSTFGFKAPLYTSLPARIVGLPLNNGNKFVSVSDSNAGGREFEAFVPNNLSIAAVPAPAGIWLLATGLAGLGGRRWLRTKITS